MLKMVGGALRFILNLHEHFRWCLHGHRNSLREIRHRISQPRRHFNHFRIRSRLCSTVLGQRRGAPIIFIQFGFVHTALSSVHAHARRQNARKVMLLLLAATGLLPAPLDRRALLRHTAAAVAFTAPTPSTAATPQTLEELPLSKSGIRWFDLKAGTGAPPMTGDRCVLDYMLRPRGGAKVYSSIAAQQPFAWTLGDGTVIKGLEIAVGGTADMPPLLPGGARRVVIPQQLGYGAKMDEWTTREDGSLDLTRWKLRGDVGPIPPEDYNFLDQTGDKVNAYKRFKDIYLNEYRMQVPDLVFDIKLVSVETPTAPTPSPPPLEAPIVSPPSADALGAPGAPDAAELERQLQQLKQQLAEKQQQQQQQQPVQD